MAAFVFSKLHKVRKAALMAAFVFSKLHKVRKAALMAAFVFSGSRRSRVGWGERSDAQQ